jgi:hypothetical protein
MHEDAEKMAAAIARLGGLRPLQGDAFDPPSEMEIAAIETRMGDQLPIDYRGFLATFGACSFRGENENNPYVVFQPLSTLPKHVSSTGKALFDAFYGRKRDDRDPFSLQVRIDFFTDRMPKSIVPIGDDGGAGYICLGVKGRESGRVYYWDQASEPLDEESYLEDYGESRPPQVQFDNVHLIAESFSDFILRLELRTE